MDLGGFTLTLAILGIIGWLTFLVNQSRVRRRRAAAPSNRQPLIARRNATKKRGGNQKEGANGIDLCVGPAQCNREQQKAQCQSESCGRTAIGQLAEGL